MVRNCPRLREAKDTWELNITHDSGLEPGFFKKMKQLGKTEYGFMLNKTTCQG